MAAKKNKSNLQRKLKNIFYHYENGSNGESTTFSKKLSLDRTHEMINMKYQRLNDWNEKVMC